MTRTFGLGEVLSVTTGRLLCELGDLYGILNYLTGDNLFTHQLPRAMDEAAPRVLACFPHLVGVGVPELTGMEQVQSWLAAVEPTLGTEFPLEPLPERDHTHISPFAELRMMRPDLPIVAVQVEDS